MDRCSSRALLESFHGPSSRGATKQATDKWGCSILATSAVSILATSAVRFNARLQPAVEDEPVALHGSITCGSTEASLAVLTFVVRFSPHYIKLDCKKGQVSLLESITCELVDCSILATTAVRF